MYHVRMWTNVPLPKNGLLVGGVEGVKIQYLRGKEEDERQICLLPTLMLRATQLIKLKNLT